MEETTERQLTSLTQHVKHEICMHKISNPLLTDKELKAWVKLKFKANVHETTIGRALKRKYHLFMNTAANSVKRNRIPHNPRLEEALYKWFLGAQEAKLVVLDNLLVEKAKALHDSIEEKSPGKLKDYKYTNGWLHNSRNATIS